MLNITNPLDQLYILNNLENKLKKIDTMNKEFNFGERLILINALLKEEKRINSDINKMKISELFEWT